MYKYVTMTCLVTIFSKKKLNCNSKDSFLRYMLKFLKFCLCLSHVNLLRIHDNAIINVGHLAYKFNYILLESYAVALTYIFKNNFEVP